MDDKDTGKSQGKRQVESIPDGSSSEAEAEAEIPDGLTEPSVKSRLQKYRRSLREQQWSEEETVVAHQVSEGGDSGVAEDSDVDPFAIVFDDADIFGDDVDVSDAYKVFDKMSQRTWDSESCATQITVSSSASQREVSSASASASASNFRRLDQSSRSDFTPLVLDSFVQKGAKGVGMGHQHDDEDEDSKRALQKEKMFSILLTPSDVGELNRLVIPKDYARTYLPKFHPGDNSLLLSVEDPVGKPWIFSYMYWSSSDTYFLTEGWSGFVKEKLLQAGDTVSFYRGLGEQGENKLFISWIQKEEEGAAYTFTPSTLHLDTKTSFMAETFSLAPGRTFHDMDWENVPSPKFKQRIPPSSAATYKEASFRRIPDSWRSDFTPYDRFVPLYKFTVFKFVLNIVRWKRRASARLAQINNNRKDEFPADWWFKLGGLPVEKDASSNSLAIFQGKSISVTRTLTLLRQLAGERRSKLESMVKLVVNIVRWKRRALSRHRNRRPIKIKIKMEDRTMDDLLQEEYIVAESPCTLFQSDSYVQDMDVDFHSSPLLDQIPYEFDAMIVDDALFYCALFPPDHEFEKDTLVQVWMALGIFVDEPMERFSSLLFEDCLTKGYFQFLRTNLITGKAMYKFIQKTQSLPLSIGSHINLSMVSPEVTHASIRCCDLKDSTALLGFQRLKQLRTLIFLHGHELSFKQVPRNFFLLLRDLQVLDLSQTRLMELPTSIGIMKCLCFLDLSDTLIKRLPEAIGCLEKLQTLKLKGCLNISTLPKGMRKLINLRHLDFDVFRQLRSMPEGMGDLANIQTLSAFLVGVEDGCSIRQIKNMNNLSGSFCISRLENVLTKDEAEEACLSNKTQLKKIELHWSDSQDEDVVGYRKVLSSLQPNTSLEELNISCYGGLELPSWICDPKFSQLVSITLFECENCLVLPSLGQLPSLKYLNIVNFHKLKVIDHKFYGNLGIQGYVAFPKLEKLTVENMLSLEEWSGIRSFEFPCLLNLTIKHCPKLHSICTLSCLSSLEKLEISHCAVLASCPDGKLPARVETFIIEGCPLISVKFLNGGEDWQKVAHIPHIWIDHKEISLG